MRRPRSGPASFHDKSVTTRPVVFADINAETYNIDPASVEKCVTEKTKAVVAVDAGFSMVMLLPLNLRFLTDEGHTFLYALPFLPSILQVQRTHLSGQGAG